MRDIQNCRQCSAADIRECRLPEYEDDLMGIPVVLVNAVKQKRCEKCGAVLSNCIPDVEGLRAALAISRINDPLKLNGRDIRFLRKALGFSAKQLAETLEVTPATVSRWENGRDIIGATNEKLLRLIVGGMLWRSAPAIDFDPDEIVRMRIQSVRAQEDMKPIRLEYVAFKMPKQRKSRHWGLDEAA